MKNSVLAVKAVNQYRKRDIIPYLGLRYYLDNNSARRDRWVKEVSCQLTVNQQNTTYLKMYHYKETMEDGAYKHREMHLPAPNEALAETALVSELSKYDEFRPKPYVYSYRFAKESESVGVFQPYFNGFKERQKDIATACHQDHGDVVLYTDIKRFYPSIRADDALRVWREYSIKASLPQEHILLGEKFLENHKKVCELSNAGEGLLTGPLFSHVIANLLLDNIDQEMHDLTNGKYWRYVDDVTLLGTNTDVVQWRLKLEGLLERLELELHIGDKDFKVNSEEWLEGENDFQSSIGLDWISLVADTKRFLIANPSLDNAEKLAKAFRENNIRLPLMDYSQAVQESSGLQKFKDWFLKYNVNGWSRKIVERINIERLLNLADASKHSLYSSLEKLLNIPVPEAPYQRKRIIPKLRFLSGRLMYLLEEEELLNLAIKLSAYPELNLLVNIMLAIAKRDVTEVLKMGSNATQAAAQLLRISNEPVTFTIDKIDEIIEQSLAVLILNGISVQSESELSELRQFSLAKNIPNLMNSEDGFLQEISCLHGIGESRHSAMLDKAFDRDEELSLDVINQLQNSSHC